MKSYHFPIIIEHDLDGFFAYSPDLQGCYTQGDTYEEALKNVQDAIKLHLEDRRGAKELIQPTKSISVAAIDVAV